MHTNYVNADTITEEHSFGVTVDYSLDIILSNNTLTIPILPNEDGKFGRSSTSVYVDTNNAAGYTLTLQSNTDTLISKQTNSKIDPLTNPTTCTNESDDACDTFPVNQWGYRIGDTGSYLPATNIVNNPVRLAQTSTVTMTTDPAATLYFGAKINTDKPTGIYDGVELTFIATANPTPASVCPNNATSFTDPRDGQVYEIGELADGRCWMLENLRLGAVNFADYADMGNKNILAKENSNIKSDTWEIPASTSSFGSYTSAKINTSKIDSTGGGYVNAKYGVYYNYCAASAGTICTNNNSNDALYDICPAGWRLPTKSEYEVLKEEYYTSLSLINALKIPFSGYYENNSLRNYGDGGRNYFWTSSYSGYNQMRALMVTSSSIGFDNSGNEAGDSIRCIFKLSSSQ